MNLLNFDLLHNSLCQYIIGKLAHSKYRKYKKVKNLTSSEALSLFLFSKCYYMDCVACVLSFIILLYIIKGIVTKDIFVFAVHRELGGFIYKQKEEKVKNI